MAKAVMLSRMRIFGYYLPFLLKNLYGIKTAEKKRRDDVYNFNDVSKVLVMPKCLFYTRLDVCYFS